MKQLATAFVGEYLSQEVQVKLPEVLMTQVEH